MKEEFKMMNQVQVQKTDKEMVNQIFKAFRQAGYIAKQNNMCCSTCGWAAIENQYGRDVEKAVFYHRQNADAFNKDKMLTYPLYLTWMGDGEELVRIIEENGMKAEWKGTEAYRISILPSQSQTKTA